MNKRTQILSRVPLLILVAASAVLTGCVSAHLTHLDPAFTPTALKEGELAIGGVTTAGTAEATC